jgi:hypothetical protein
MIVMNYLLLQFENRFRECTQERRGCCALSCRHGIDVDAVLDAMMSFGAFISTATWNRDDGHLTIRHRVDFD